MISLPDDIDVLSHLDREDYVKLENPRIDHSTEKAIKVDGHWVPKVYVRCDFDSNIYVVDWLYGEKWE